jgi:serine/threonine-protein kinase
VIAQERTQAPTPWHLVTAIAIETLRALQAAHGRIDERGQPAPVFHRDVNPSNILLSVNGIVKLSDFGVARAADRGSMTDPGVVKGKVSYMSPEMIQGKPASARTDLYAVGIILWEALTQKKLFYGKSLPETAMMVMKGEVPWLGHEREDLPQELVETVHIALAPNPDHRYESALDMLRALCNVLRVHPEPTDSAPLARSVRQALALLSAM